MTAPDSADTTSAPPSLDKLARCYADRAVQLGHLEAKLAAMTAEVERNRKLVEEARAALAAGMGMVFVDDDPRPSLAFRDGDSWTLPPGWAVRFDEQRREWVLRRESRP